MSINKTIISAVTPIVPVCVPDLYQPGEGEHAAEVYCTFNYNAIPDNFGDDEPEHERVLIQVHLYAPLGFDTVKRRMKIKKALAAAGMTWPAYTNASDKDGQHHVFECETVREVGAE